MNGGDQLYTIPKEHWKRAYRGKSSQSKKVIIAVESKKASLMKHDTLPRFIHPNVCRIQAVDSKEIVNNQGQLETNLVWKFEYKPASKFLDYTFEYPQFRKKLLTDVLKGLVYLHGNGLAHGDLKSDHIIVIKTEKVPMAVVTFTDIFKKTELAKNQQKDIQHWGRLVCETYTGKSEAESHELPSYMRRFVETCFFSNSSFCSAHDILTMIEDEDAQKEIDVQLAIDLSSSISSMYNKLEKKYAKMNSPTGLKANFNEFRRY